MRQPMNHLQVSQGGHYCIIITRSMFIATIYRGMQLTSFISIPAHRCHRHHYHYHHITVIIIIIIIMTMPTPSLPHTLHSDPRYIRY
jgi:hypothetical protein